jgi:hypothetical protein
MWKNYIPALKLYHDTAIRIWKERGYNNTMKEYNEPAGEFPSWLGNEEFHAAHRSNLLRKDPVYYGKFGWKESTELPYVWLSKEQERLH